MDWEVRRFAELDSTNSYLMDEARAGAAEGLVAVVEVQLEGRGRLQRAWEAPAGTSLLVSVLLRPDLPAGRFHLAVACMALAAAEACAEVAGVRPGLKWPNDLVVGSGDLKLGGILAEVDLPPAVVRPDDTAFGTIPAGTGLPPAVVVGLGLNLDWPVGTLPAGAAELGPLDRRELLAAVLRHLDALYGDWSCVSKEYRAACVTVGRQVRVEMSGEILTGTAVAISDEGHLVVAPTQDDGATERLRTIAAADVVHLRPDVRH